MDSLVFDTSALLNFGHRGELAVLLRKLASEYQLFTTPGAQAELTDPNRKQFYTAFLREHFTIKTASTAQFDLINLARLARVLDPGEITVMTLAREIQGIAVLDEKAARHEAKLLDLRCIGTLGLLHLGLQRLWFTDADCLAHVVKLCDARFAIRRPTSGQTFADYIQQVA